MFLPAPGDPYYAKTALYLDCEGSDGSTTVLDSSPNRHTITVAGNAKLATAEKAFGNSSLYLDGSGDYLTLPANVIEFVADDFTVELWMKSSQTRQNSTLCMRGNLAFDAGSWSFLYNNTESVGDVAVWSADYSVVTALLVTSGVSVIDNSWHHIAWVKSGNNHYLYVDGTQYASRLSTSLAFTARTEVINIGRDENQSNRELLGYLDGIRITLGVARYTEGFTAPTLFPALPWACDVRSSMMQPSFESAVRLGL